MAGLSILAIGLGASRVWHAAPVPVPAAASAAATPAPSMAASTAPSTEPSAASPTPDVDVAALGARRTYQIDHSQIVALGAAKSAAQAPSSGMKTVLTSRVRADLAIVTLASERSRIRYAARLSNVDALANGQPFPDATIPKDLARPFSFETDSDGKIVAVAFEVGTSSDARGMLKSLLADTQVVVRGHDATATSMVWTAQEEDPTGEYEARYARGTDATQLRKTRTKYLRIATENGLRDAQAVGMTHIKDDTQIVLSPAGDVISIASKTETDMQFGQAMPLAHTTSQLASHLRNVDDDSAELASLNEEWKRQQKVDMASPPDGDAASKEATQRDADQQIVKDAKLVDLERDLAALAPSAGRERSTQINRLQANFRLHPDDTKKAVRDVRTASIADGQAITAALGGAATPEALKALVDIGGTSGTPMDVRLNAIGALAINPTPSAASVQGLTAMTSDADPDIHAASTLALGGAASALRDADPETYQDAVGTLLTSYSSAQTTQDKVLALRALGNAGDPQVLPLAEQAIKDPDVSVRLAAVTAVRFVPGAEADGILMGVMQDDADPSVRSQAVATAEGYRVLGMYIQTFGIILQNDAATSVRRSVVHALNVVKNTPEAMTLLAYVARGDASEELRKMAETVIESARAVAAN